MPVHESSRRGFVRTLALGGAAGLVARPSRAEPQDPAGEAKSELDPEVEARMALILARYGERLDDDAKRAIYQEVEGVVQRGRRLKDVALENADELFPVFHPYRKPLA
jgi:hypothetical protein